jgi:hypothetical protein
VHVLLQWRVGRVYYFVKLTEKLAGYQGKRRIASDRGR